MSSMRATSRWLRLGGSAIFTIDYGTYQFEEPRALPPAEAAEAAAHALLVDVR
jgi:hypothetical protein